MSRDRVDELVKAQGWSNEDMLDHAMRFVQNAELTAAWVAYLECAAAVENAPAPHVETWKRWRVVVEVALALETEVEVSATTEDDACERAKCQVRGNRFLRDLDGDTVNLEGLNETHVTVITVEEVP